MEWKKIVFPAPKSLWTWSDYKDEIFWLPVPKNSMIQLKSIIEQQYNQDDNDMNSSKYSYNNNGSFSSLNLKYDSRRNDNVFKKKKDKDIDLNSDALSSHSKRRPTSIKKPCDNKNINYTDQNVFNKYNKYKDKNILMEQSDEHPEEMEVADEGVSIHKFGGSIKGHVGLVKNQNRFQIPELDKKFNNQLSDVKSFDWLNDVKKREEKKEEKGFFDTVIDFFGFGDDKEKEKEALTERVETNTTKDSGIKKASSAYTNMFGFNNDANLQHSKVSHDFNAEKKIINSRIQWEKDMINLEKRKNQFLLTSQSNSELSVISNNSRPKVFDPLEFKHKPEVANSIHSSSNRNLHAYTNQSMSK